MKIKVDYSYLIIFAILFFVVIFLEMSNSDKSYTHLLITSIAVILVGVLGFVNLDEEK